MNKTKILAWYLPQFHEIEENNKWWGKGFTDWVNVKSAKPLFKKHKQPRIPLNKNYYDLDNVNTLGEQFTLASKYGIDGFCMYHYWFKGKLLLEKPAEKLLANKAINFRYCFSWANEPWSRTWSGADSQILMPQEYGNEGDWHDHFNYLLQFFNDDRYIKINNKPIFVLYTSKNITNCKEMIDCWNSLALKNGFDGLYIIETLNSFQKESSIPQSEMIAFLEPMHTVKHDNNIVKKGILKVMRFFMLYKYIAHDYSSIWEKILSRDYNSYQKNIGFGAFVDWDNTPRKKGNATYFKGSTPNQFEDYLKKLKLLADNKENSIIFINAWNEWGEGAYLEPDELSKFAYLESIKSTTV